MSLTVAPIAMAGEEIVANIKATDVSETIVELSAPDTVVISQPHRQVVDAGTFAKKISWLVEHVQPNTTALVEITVSAGSLTQKGLCRING